ncbi:MAG: DUF4236 domain-containing protein [Bacteroidales bacterium]|nr:DUF4236 domain-containing protein [Candidatus Colimorpha onthohippi]
MIFNNKKKVKIAPGVCLNITKKGVNSTAGMREASVFFDKKGSYVSAGTPGTGYYSREKSGGEPVALPNLLKKAPSEHKFFYRARHFIGFWLCAFLALSMLICGLTEGGFWYWAFLVLFCYRCYVHFPKMRRKSSSAPKSEKASSIIRAARKELGQPHSELEQRILRNLISCYALADEIDVEEGIIASLKESGKKPELLSEHEQKLKTAQDKLNDIQYDADSELSDEERSAYEGLCQKFEVLLSSDKVWSIKGDELDAQQITFAQRLSHRTSIGVGVGVFNFIKSRYDVPIISDRNVHLFFYPKFLIAASSPSSFSVIPYQSLSLEGRKHSLGEDGIVPFDSKKVSTTWKYLDASGMPDKRFSNNKKIPVMEYGYLTMQFSNYSLRYLFSNSNALIGFTDAFDILKYGDNGTNKSNLEPLVSDETPTELNYFKNVNYAAKQLYEHIKMMNKSLVVNDLLLKYEEKFPNFDSITTGEINPRLMVICWYDAIVCYEGLGHKFDIDTEEGLGLVDFLIMMIYPKYPEVYNRESLMRTKGREIYRPLVSVVTSNTFTGFSEDKLLLVEMIRAENIDNDMVSKYVILLYRLTSIIAKADGVVYENEAKWLRHIMSFANIKDENTNDREQKITSENIQSNGGASNLGNELSSLIGLSSVKEEVSKLSNFIKIQQMRKQKGMPVTPMSYHCVFTGNPGTGKTTVARFVAGIYKNLGIIKKGHLVETDRSGLVAEYVGQTAVKTNKIIDSALDGVLFIDEAYSLVQGSSNDFGTEAISTLLKRMEDDRDRLVVILAGYSNEMKQFIDSNPGLQSRFNRYIYFPDYDADELRQIFIHNVEKNEYELTAEADQKLRDVLSKAVAEKDQNFGNGRFVRNLFEKTIENQAARLSSVSHITRKSLVSIEAVDIPC